MTYQAQNAAAKAFLPSRLKSEADPITTSDEQEGEISHDRDAQYSRKNIDNPDIDCSGNGGLSPGHDKSRRIIPEAEALTGTLDNHAFCRGDSRWYLLALNLSHAEIRSRST